jgi:molybdopterin-guanine dinucleotide biosynthesis protein A
LSAGAEGAFDGIVLAGGQARRLGGVDKAELEVGGARLLDRVLAALARARRVVVVGPPRAVDRDVMWTREDPPGSGPVAALAAGMQHVEALVVAVLAVDLPFVDAGVVARLVAGTDDADACLLVDAEGHDQPLAAAYRTPALRDALARTVPARDAAVRGLLAHMSVARLDAAGAARDCDTWDEVAAARRAHGRAH